MRPATPPTVRATVRPAARLAALVTAAAVCAMLLPPVVGGPAPATAGQPDGPLAAACPPEQVPAHPFDDVAGTTHEAAIGCAWWWEVAGGVAEDVFDPGSSVTRAQMATFVANLLAAVAEQDDDRQLPQVDDPPFDDVEAGSTHAASIALLAELGVVGGVADGVFAPSAEVSRAQMATFLAGAHQWAAGGPLGGEVDVAGVLAGFVDVDPQATHAEAIARLVAAEVSLGVAEDRYAPQQAVSRGQMASFVMRTAGVLVDGEVLVTPVQPDEDPPGAPGDLALEVGEWMELVGHRVRHDVVNPVMVTRAFAGVAVALHEGVAAADPEVASLAPHVDGLDAPDLLDPPADDPDLDAPADAPDLDAPADDPGGGDLLDPASVAAAAAAAAAPEVLETSRSVGMAVELRDAQLDRRVAEGVPGPVVTASRQLGTTVGGEVRAWLADDGIREAALMPAPRLPTAPFFPLPVAPGLGDVDPAVADLSACRAGPPVEVDLGDPAFTDELTTVIDDAAAASQAGEPREIAEFWADPDGASLTPPGHWAMLGASAAHADDLGLAEATGVLAAATLAMRDAGIETFRAKYAYDHPRPSTVINDLVDADWRPPLNDPAHPEHPSGHATFSGAGSTVLAATLGDRPFTDALGSIPGRVQPRTFDTFAEAAEEGAWSRIYGGIHFPAAGAVGLEVGECVAEQVVDVMGEVVPQPDAQPAVADEAMVLGAVAEAGEQRERIDVEQLASPLTASGERWRAPWLQVAGSPGTSPVGYDDRAEQMGVDHVQHRLQPRADCLDSTCMIDRFSGGVAVGDVVGNGHPDLYFTVLDGPDRLYRNDGDATFTDVSDQTGITAATDLPTNGVGMADLTGDGALEIYLTTVGETGGNLLLVDQGDGTFADEAAARGAEVPSDDFRGGFSVAFGDYTGDGRVDLHVSEWSPLGGTAEEVRHARLLRNDGGTFTDVTEAAGVDTVPDPDPDAGTTARRPYFFGAAFVDLDGSGRQDLAIAGDFRTSRLYWNEGDGTFTDGSDEAGVTSAGNAMGSAFGDVTGDGRLDWFVTSIYDPRDRCRSGRCGWDHTGNRLYANDGDRTFSDITTSAGVRDGGWGWGAALADLTNSGELDAVMTNGVALPHDRLEVLPYADDLPRLWLGQGGGQFSDDAAADAGLDARGTGTGLAVADLTGDGWLEIVEVTNGSKPRIHRAVERPDHHRWLRVEAPGTDSEPEGRGAVVRVTPEAGDDPVVRHIGASTHYLGQSERVAHVGLGAHNGTVAEVEVTWPATGRQVVLTDVEVDQVLTVTEPDEQP